MGTARIDSEVFAKRFSGIESYGNIVETYEILLAPM
jgi:hypothetical protein